MKIKPILLAILCLLYIGNIIAQGDARLMLENKYYGDKNSVKYTIKIKPSFGQLNSVVSSIMEESIVNGLSKHQAFEDIKPLKEDVSFKTLLNNIPYQYLLRVNLNLAEKNPLRKKNNLYVFSADIEYIDVVKGITLIFDSVDWIGEGVSNSSYDGMWRDKPFEDFMTALELRIANHTLNLFPISPNIINLIEVKGNKVKKVGIDNRKYLAMGKPDKLFVNRVVDEVEIDGKKHFTYRIVGVIRPTKEISKKGIRTMNVGDGKKEILKYFNEKQILYTTTKLLGDDE